jgi:predicted amidohydrolase
MTGSRALAVAQTCPVTGDVSANIEEHIALTRVAAAERAQIVVFPELSLTGYEMDLGHALAFSEDDPRLEPLRLVAVSCSVIVVAGAPVRIGSQVHIGAFALAPERTTSLYTKHRLGAFHESARCDGIVPPPEASVFAPGDRNPLVRLGEHTAAIAICADIGNAAHPQNAKARGADTYLASMFVIPSEYEGEERRLRSYAAGHAMMVAFANYGSATGGLATAGCSSIWSSAGDLLVRLPASGSGVAVVHDTPDGPRATTWVRSRF